MLLCLKNELMELYINSSGNVNSSLTALDPLDKVMVATDGIRLHKQ